MIDAVSHAISNLPVAMAAAAAGPDGIASPPPAAAAIVPAAAAPAPAPRAGSKAGGGGGSKAAAKAGKPRPPVRSAREAALEFMNVPHPLDILADAGAYGPDGAISRYHNPDNCERLRAFWWQWRWMAGWEQACPPGGALRCLQQRPWLAKQVGASMSAECDS